MDKLDFKNPSYNRETGETAWSMLYFGSYPQTEIKDNELASGITEAVYNEDGDALADGIKYRRIKQNGVFRYFRWDKIQWRVLWNDGKTLFVISDKGLDCKAYDSTDNFVIWEQSSLREWLAGCFYNMAFDSREQEAILMHETETSYICNGENITDKTNDKIYLLSIKELRTSRYGFWDEKVYWEHTIDKKINRRMRPTSYAQACGVWVYKHDSNKKWYIAKPDSSREGCCCWWTRSPCADTRYGTKMKNTKVTESGAIDKYDYGHILHRMGNAVAVVPVMHLDLEKLQVYYNQGDLKIDASVELRLVHFAQKVASMYKDKIEQKYYKQLCDAIETCRDYYINGKKDWGCMYDAVLSDGGIWEYAESQHEEKEIQDMWTLEMDILSCNCYLGCMSEDGITPEDLELRGENIPAFVELLEKHINEKIDYDKIFQFWGSGICY